MIRDLSRRKHEQDAAMRALYTALPYLALVGCCLLLPSAAHIHSRSQKIGLLERDKPTWSTWLLALASSLLVGACGVFPLLLMRWVRLDASAKDKGPLKLVLSFAVGGLLGDVFLHLLPEAWGSRGELGQPSSAAGVWVIAGLMAFLLVEKIVKSTEQEEEEEEEVARDRERGRTAARRGEVHTISSLSKVGALHASTGRQSSYSATVNGASGTNTLLLRCHQAKGVEPPHCSPTPYLQPAPPTASSSPRVGKAISGYLNLAANCTDNFTHGLALAASYAASPTVGLLTTLAILCHELPHEVGDFAILLNSGFDHWTAAKAQMVTACGGLVGVVFGLALDHVSESASWMLPFTAGGFLYIALVSIVPDLLRDQSRLRDSIAQLAAVVLGIVVMAMVTVIEKKSCSHVPFIHEVM